MKYCTTINRLEIYCVLFPNSFEVFTFVQRVTKICRLSWLTNRALAYESVHRSPNKLGRSSSLIYVTYAFISRPLLFCVTRKSDLGWLQGKSNRCQFQKRVRGLGESWCEVQEKISSISLDTISYKFSKCISCGLFTSARVLHRD